MPKQLIVKPHLSIDKIAYRYRTASDGVSRGQWHVIWLLVQGRSTADVAAITGYTRTWVRMLAHRYNEMGPDGLGDGRRSNRGAEPILSDSQQTQLRAALRKPAPGGGAWNSRKVAGWIAEAIGVRKVNIQLGWAYMRRLTGPQRRPRRIRRPK